MINSEHQELLILQSLVFSDFIFHDDAILEKPYIKKIEDINQPDNEIKGFFFLTEDKKGVKLFLQRLGFKHNNELNIKLKELQRSVKVFASGNVVIYVAVVNSLAAAQKYFNEYKEAMEAMEKDKKDNEKITNTVT